MEETPRLQTFDMVKSTKDIFQRKNNLTDEYNLGTYALAVPSLQAV